jgi:hypothetical protein
MKLQFTDPSQVFYRNVSNLPFEEPDPRPGAIESAIPAYANTGE